MAEKGTDAVKIIDPDIHEDYLHEESGLVSNAKYIAFPKDETELRAVIEYCMENNLRYSPQGSRTTITGGSYIDTDCIINLSKMKDIGEVVKEDGEYYIEVSCGAALEEIRSKLKDSGLEFLPDPSEESATIGGLFAANAKGANSHIYGSVSDNIKDAVIISGEDIPQKEFPGSMGRRGIAVRLKLRLQKKKLIRWAVMFFFKEADRALSFCEEIISGKDAFKNSIEKLELLDDKSLEIINSARKSNTALKSVSEFPGESKAAVIVQLGADEDIDEELMLLLDTFDRLGGSEDYTWAFEGEKEIKTVSIIRHAVSEGVIQKNNLIRRSFEKAHVISADHSVPCESLRQIFYYYKNTIKETGLEGAVFGHALSGRLHGAIFAASDEEMKKADDLLKKWSEKVQELKGRLYDENGMGLLRI